MLRSVAITRINDGLGFFAAGNSLESKIALRLQEAQRDLEKGKTLPKFLLQENQTLTLSSAAHTATLPTGFLRESDENRLHFYPTTSTRPIFLTRKYFQDATEARTETLEDSPDPVEPVPPSVYVIRRSTVDFITTADTTYTLYWDYYKAADVLSSDIENAWLENAPEWLIGEAGLRIAMDLRDKDAVELFSELAKRGRAACFGEDLAAELASGPLQMGANQ